MVQGLPSHLVNEVTSSVICRPQGVGTKDPQIKDYLLTDSSPQPGQAGVRCSAGLLGKGLPSLACGSITEC